MQNNSYLKKIPVNKVSLWKNQKPLLSRLDLELTERCNNNCLHCCINLPASDSVAQRKELSTKQVKNILKEALALGCLKVRFTGGEPLLRKDFEELYLFSRKSGFRVMLFTNATLITPHLAKLFSRIPPLEKIEVSVYGMTKNTYESFTRNPGSYASAWQGIRLLQEYKIPFVAKGTILDEKERIEFENWTKGVPAMAGKLPTMSMFFDLRCRRDNLQKNILIKKIRFSPEAGLKVLNQPARKYVKGMRDFCSKFMGVRGAKLFNCGCGGGGCVNAYGVLKPCMMLGHPEYGYDLLNGSLKDALLNVFPKKIRAKKAKNPEYLLKCAKCFLMGLCEQCPAKSWTESGILDAPVEYCCTLAHAQARYLGLIKTNENAWEVGDWKKRIQQFTKEDVYGSKN